MPRLSLLGCAPLLAPFHPTLVPAPRLAGRFIAGALLADRSDLGRRGVLLHLDEGKHLAQALVLGDRRVGDALLMVIIGSIRQENAFPADLEPAIGKGIGLDILPDRAAGVFGVLQDELLAIVMNDELPAQLSLVAQAQDLGQP